MGNDFLLLTLHLQQKSTGHQLGALCIKADRGL